MTSTITQTGDSNTIPTGTSMAVVLDRLKRASNFASNGVYLAELPDRDPIETAALYIRAAQSMLDEAKRTLDNLTTPETSAEQ